jgi:hypothetical protein
MNDQLDLPIDAGGDVSILVDVLHRADSLFIKKLSTNDRAWSYDRETTHQNGVYVPLAERDSGFFPSLQAKERNKTDAPAILTTAFRTFWPQYDLWGTGKGGTSNLTNWTSKGEETHLTRLPKAAFKDLSPASYLVMAKSGSPDEGLYECLTIDSTSDDALLLIDLLHIDADFQSGIRVPAAEEAKTQQAMLAFAEQLLSAWQEETIEQFAAMHGTLPDTATLAAMARQKYLDDTGAKDLNPFGIDAPGDVVRHISRKIEWDLFREFQLRARAVGLIRLVAGDKPSVLTLSDILLSIIDKVAEIDALMLSASQQRKSRAGYSFEHHIEAMLADGGLPFEKQVIIEAKKRPDFVLPSLAWLQAPKAGKPSGIVLSAKTTLRERWKQVQSEMKHGSMFLATVDENIASNAIEDMASLSIYLVVPEQFKNSRDLEYRGHANVLDFKTFFDQVRNDRLPSWPISSMLN